MSTNIIPGSPQPENMNMPNDDELGASMMCYRQDCYPPQEWGPQNDGMCDDWNPQMIPGPRMMNNNWMDGPVDEMGSTSYPITSPRRISGGQQQQHHHQQQQQQHRQAEWGAKNNKVRFRCPPNPTKMMMMHDERPGSVGFDFGRNDDPYGKDQCGMQHGMQCSVDGDDGTQDHEINYPKNSAVSSTSPSMAFPAHKTCNNPRSPSPMSVYPSPSACSTPRGNMSPSNTGQVRTVECDYPGNIGDMRKNSPNEVNDLQKDNARGTSPKMQLRSPMPPQFDGDPCVKDSGKPKMEVHGEGNWNEEKNELNNKQEDAGDWNNSKTSVETEDDLVVKQWQQQRIALPPEVMEQWQQQLEQMEQTPGYGNLTTAQRQQLHYQTQQQLLMHFQEQQRKMQQEPLEQQQGVQLPRQKSYHRGMNNEGMQNNQRVPSPNMQEHNTRYGSYLQHMQQRPNDCRRPPQECRQQQTHYSPQYPQSDRKPMRGPEAYQELNRQDMMPPSGRMGNNGYAMNYPMNSRQMHPQMAPEGMGNYQMPMGPPHGMNSMRRPEMQQRGNMPPTEHYQQGRSQNQNYQYMPTPHPQLSMPREHINQFPPNMKRDFYPYPQPQQQQQQQMPQQSPPRQMQQGPVFPSQTSQGYPQAYYQNTLRGFGAQAALPAKPVGCTQNWPPQPQQPPVTTDTPNLQNENYRTPKESAAHAQYGDRSEADQVEEAHVKRDTTPHPPTPTSNHSQSPLDLLGNEALLLQQQQQHANDPTGKLSESGTQQKLESLPQGQKRIEFIIQQLRQNMGPGQQQQLQQQQQQQPQQQQQQQQQPQQPQQLQPVQSQAPVTAKIGNEDNLDKIQIHNPEPIYRQDMTREDQDVAGNPQNLSQRLADVLAEAERVMRQCKGTQEALWNDLATRDRNFATGFTSWSKVGPNPSAGTSGQVKSSWSDGNATSSTRGRSPIRRDDDSSRDISPDAARNYPRSPRSRSRHHHNSPPDTVPLTTAEGGDGDMFSTPTQDLRALVGDLNSRILMIRERCLNQLGTEQRGPGQDSSFPVANASVQSDGEVDGGIPCDATQVLDNKKSSGHGGGGGGGGGSGGNSLVNLR
uniref:Uncharacterized protein n=1 Tax=Strigamia maritima TaxID=126957 RepID=T1IIX3_STRMM